MPFVAKQRDPSKQSGLNQITVEQRMKKGDSTVCECFTCERKGSRLMSQRHVDLVQRLLLVSRLDSVPGLSPGPAAALPMTPSTLYI